MDDPLTLAETPAGQVLYALASFDIKDPLGEIADRRYREGYLFAVSLGWDDVDDRGVPVRVSTRRAVDRDVLEFSVVSVPADASALIDEAGDRARRRAREALLPEYRRLDPVPPAHLDAVIVAGLSPERRAALFVNGALEEIEMAVQTAAGTRATTARPSARLAGSTRQQREGPEAPSSKAERHLCALHAPDRSTL